MFAKLASAEKDVGEYCETAVRCTQEGELDMCQVVLAYSSTWEKWLRAKVSMITRWDIYYIHQWVSFHCQFISTFLLYIKTWSLRNMKFCHLSAISVSRENLSTHVHHTCVWKCLLKRRRFASNFYSPCKWRKLWDPHPKQNTIEMRRHLPPPPKV